MSTDFRGVCAVNVARESTRVYFVARLLHAKCLWVVVCGNIKSLTRTGHAEHNLNVLSAVMECAKKICCMDVNWIYFGSCTSVTKCALGVALAWGEYAFNVAGVLNKCALDMMWVQIECGLNVCMCIKLMCFEYCMSTYSIECLHVY